MFSLKKNGRIYEHILVQQILQYSIVNEKKTYIHCGTTEYWRSRMGENPIIRQSWLLCHYCVLCPYSPSRGFSSNPASPSPSLVSIGVSHDHHTCTV